MSGNKDKIKAKIFRQTATGSTGIFYALRFADHARTQYDYVILSLVSCLDHLVYTVRTCLLSHFTV